jgi:hypothetical protein
VIRAISAHRCVRSSAILIVLLASASLLTRALLAPRDGLIPARIRLCYQPSVQRELAVVEPLWHEAANISAFEFGRSPAFLPPKLTSAPVTRLPSLDTSSAGCMTFERPRRWSHVIVDRTRHAHEQPLGRPHVAQDVTRRFVSTTTCPGNADAHQRQRHCTGQRDKQQSSRSVPLCMRGHHERTAAWARPAATG